MGFLKKDSNGHNDACQEKWGMMCSGDRHMFLRWVVGVLILIFIFSLGYKMGVITERVSNSFGSYGVYGGGMMGNGYRPMMYRGYYDGYGFQNDGYGQKQQQYFAPTPSGQQPTSGAQQPNTIQPPVR